MTDLDPEWESAASMCFPRRLHQMVLLPNGKVFAAGGLKATEDPGPEDPLDEEVLMTELYDPSMNSWTEMAPLAFYRLYHSTMFLLPDARVVMAGNFVNPQTDPNTIPPPPTEILVQLGATLTAQIYSPPYLFDESGDYGKRPVIDSAPEVIHYGETFSIVSNQPINAASLIRLPAVTHTFNQNQRYIPLTLTGEEPDYFLTAPANGYIAPPGYYMLFVLSNGVPSVAAMVRLEACADDAACNDNELCTLDRCKIS